MSALASKSYKIDWVNVVDGLPDNDDFVHVRVQVNSNPNITSAYYANYCNEKKQWLMPKNWDDCIVTHWGKVK